MISIFNGRKLSLDGNEDVTYAQISVALRDKIHCFNTGKTCNPFAVFMAIALHADKDGWAWPGRSLLSKETGIKSAIGNSIKHLCKMTIAGHRVLTCWRERRDNGTWGRTLYRIFPDAWGEYVIFPERFKADNLKPWTPNSEPPPHNLPLDKPPLDHVPLKYNHVQEETEEKKDADAFFYGDAGKPSREPITTSLPASAKDPIDLTIKTQGAREKEKQWTVPGADDSWSGKPLQGFCVLAGRTELKDSERKHWPGQLSKWAQDWHATPDETYAAIRAIPDSEFHWMTFKTPFAPTFQETMDAMIDRIRNGQPINVKGNGHRDNGSRSYENVPGAYIDDGSNPLGIDLSIFQESAEAPA